MEKDAELVDAGWKDLAKYLLKQMHTIAKGDNYGKAMSARGAMRIARHSVAEAFEAMGLLEEP